VSDTTEPMTIESAVEQIMAEDDAPAPETTEGEESEVSETEEVEAEASEDEDTTEAEADEEAETDEAEADEAEEEESDEDEAEDEDDNEEPERFPVMVDGQEELKTLDELKESYSGQAKIRKDIWQNAQTRKQLEQAAQAMMNQQEELLQLRQRIEQGGFKAPPQAPDRRLLDTDPTKYMRQRAEYEDQVAEFQREQAQFQQMAERKAAYERHQQQQEMAEQFEVLKQRIPEMADEKTAPEFAKKLMNAGTEFGFSADELSGITDARALYVLSKAVKMIELEKKQGTKKAPPKPTRTVKAKAPKKHAPDAKAKAAKARFQRTGSISDAVDAFLSSQNP